MTAVMHNLGEDEILDAVAKQIYNKDTLDEDWVVVPGLMYADRDTGEPAFLHLRENPGYPGFVSSKFPEVVGLAAGLAGANVEGIPTPQSMNDLSFCCRQIDAANPSPAVASLPAVAVSAMGHFAFFQVAGAESEDGRSVAGYAFFPMKLWLQWGNQYKDDDRSITWVVPDCPY